MNYTLRDEYLPLVEGLLAALSAASEGTGSDQANEAFMAERDELKAGLGFLSDLAEARDQAIDHFMADRAALKSRIAALETALDLMFQHSDTQDSQLRDCSDRIRNQRGALNGQQRVINAQYEALEQAALFMGKVRGRLGQIGIAISTAENGEPALDVNMTVLTNAAYASLGMAQAA